MAKKKGPEKIPLVEWMASVAGLLIISAMVALLAVEGIRERDGTPPVITVQPLRIASTDHQYVVEVVVRNATRKTAASVTIQGRLKQGNSEVETSQATLSYVPGESRRRAGLIFSHNPRNYEMQFRATGYESP